MKKFLAVLSMVLVLTVCLVGCGPKVDLSSSPYVGEWEATTCEYGGMSLDVESIVGKTTLSLTPDGKAVLTIADDAKKGKWEETEGGIIIDKDDELTFIDNDGVLTLDYSGVTFYFEK